MAGWQHYDEQTSFLANFTWTSEFSPKMVAETYKKELPVIVKVTSGYDGCDGMHEFAMEEVYCIVDIKKQKRVVMTDIKDRYISIPFDYHVKFHTVDGNNKPEGPSRLLSEICPTDASSSNFSLRMMFEQNQAVKFNDGADLGSKVKLGVIEYDEIYKERYLVCHPLQSGEILSDVVLIPIYVPISLSVAEGFVSSPPDGFSNWMKEIAASVKSFDSTSIQPCTEIVVFEESPASDYTYINPVNLFKHTMKGGSSSSSSSSADKTSSDPNDFQRYLNITQCKEKQRGRVSVFGAQLPPMIAQGQGLGKGQGQGQAQGQSQAQGQGPGRGQAQGRNEPSKTLASPGPPLPPRNYPKEPSPDKDFLSSVPPAPPPPPPLRKGPASTSSQTKSPTTSSAPAKVKRDELKVMRPSSPAKTSSTSGPSTDPSKRPRLPIPVREQIQQTGNTATRTTVKNVDDPVTGPPPSVGIKDPSPASNTKRPLPSKPAQDYRSADAIQNMNKAGFFSSGKPLKDCPPFIEDCCQLAKNNLPQCKDSIDDVEYETLPDSPEDYVFARSPLSGGRKEDMVHSPTWKSVQDIPANLNIRLLTVDELCRCLELLKMDRIVDEFRRRMVDGSLLMDLTTESLKEDFGLSLFDATKLMKFARDGWRPKTQ